MLRGESVGICLKGVEVEVRGKGFENGWDGGGT